MNSNPDKAIIVPEGMNTPEYKKLLLQCVHCGLCLESCPTYVLFGTEMDSPRGRIELMRAASEGRIDSASFRTVFREHITLCLECRACETVCPSGVQYGKLVEEARIAVEKESPPGWLEGSIKRFGMQQLMPNLRRFKQFANLFKLYQRTGLETFVRKTNLLPWRLQGMAELLPPITASNLTPGSVYPAQGTQRGTVAFFTGCVQEAFLGRINAASVRVLQRNGFEVHIPPQQTCCGAAQWHTGDKELAVTLARQNIDAFLDDRYDAVINNAGGCGLTLQEYPDLLHDDPDYQEKASRFSMKVKDFSQFLIENLLELPGARLSVRAVYSDSCHLRHGQKVVDAPRSLLRGIPGLELVEMKTPERCCGSAGIYNMLLPEPANAMLEAKITDIAATQARLIVTSNTGCHMQLVMGARRAGLPAHVLHIAEVLDYAYRAETRWLDEPPKTIRPLRSPRSNDQRWLAWLDKRRKQKTQSPRLSALREQLQPGQVLEDPVELITYERDATNDRGRMDAVIFPYNTEDVQKTLRWCDQTNTPLIARGAGSGLAGNAVAEQGGLVLKFTQMKKLLELDVEGRTAVIQPGMITQALEDTVLPFGLTYPPDPASGKVSTLGANISVNSGGPHCFKYGVTSNYVLALETLLADGQRVRLGSKALDCPEYDLAGLMTGSEGMLGVITEATVSLKHRPEAVKTMMAAFDSLEQAGEAVSAIIARGLIPATLELMDQRMLQAVEAFVKMGLPVDAAAMLILETDGSAMSVDPQMDEIVEVLQECGVKQMRIAENEAQRAQIWHARKSSAGAVAYLAPAEYTVDATVPRSKMAQALKAIREILQEAELEACMLAHAGDGNLHPMILISDPDDETLMARIRKAGEIISKYCVDIGGTITGEHGVGIEKRAFMPLMYSPDELGAMLEIKQVFDPGNILNPGKVFPEMPEIKIEKKTPTTQTPIQPVPHDAEEAASTILQLTAQGKPVFIRSAKTVQNGSNAENELSTGNLTGIHEYQPHDLYVTAGAGTRLLDLQEVLAKDGMWLPLVSPWQDSSLGGLVSSGLNAPLRMRYGSLRDLVLAMTVVLPDGRILRLGRPVVKNVAGFDLGKLFIGSRGTLGLITDLTFKIVPETRKRLSRIIPVDRLEQGLEIGRLLCSQLTGSAVLLTRGVEIAGITSQYSLVYTLEGYPIDVQAENEAVLKGLETGNTHAVPLPSGMCGSEIWASWLGSAKEVDFAYRIGLPARGLPEMLRSQKNNLAETTWIADLYSGMLYTTGAEIQEPLQQAILSHEGYAVMLQPDSGGITKRWLHQPESMDLMRKIKSRWDPQGLFNPGEFLV